MKFSDESVRSLALFKNRHVLAGIMILALAAFFRFRGLASIPWYPDECMAAEVSACLADGRAPAVGAIKQNSFFPLSSPLFPSLTTVPLIKAGLNPLLAQRAWAACLGLAICALLMAIGRFLKEPWLGLGAGAACAFAPLAVGLDQMGFYHHLGAALSVACFYAGLRFLRNKSKPWFLASCLAAGLAVASAYWLFWQFLLPPLMAWNRKKPSYLGWGLPLMLLPLALIMGWGYLADPSSFFLDARMLWSLTHTDLPENLRRWGILYSMYVVVLAYPSFALAWLGLAGWAFTRRRIEDPQRPGLWALAFTVACSLEAFRQRYNLSGFPYPLILALPWAALGLGFVAKTMLELAGTKGFRRWLFFIPAAALLLVFLKPPEWFWLRQLSAPVPETGDLVQWLKTNAQDGDVVLGQTNFNWSLEPGLKASDLDQAGAREGLGSTMVTAGYPASRFTFDPSLAQARFLIMSGPYGRDFTLKHEAARKVAQDADQEGFALVWKNSVYEIYENPKLKRAMPTGAALKPNSR